MPALPIRDNRASAETELRGKLAGIVLNSGAIDRSRFCE
ncbi:protein of unknown function [Trichlorobacter ammonificans]|uniref:Uncharacterized protein n=1 Tax=Trichlorobacter ammonificans TaxID=2916410 RepID=A0ABM9D7P8_9BACT|nr:protein of unknown function [Trichlorobacter ammonificans]